MPLVFRERGFRFFFYSLEHPPMHVHAQNADGECKFEIKPVRFVVNRGMKEKDVRTADELIREHEDLIARTWKEFFDE